MYKEGINLNTVSREKLKALPGIGDELSRSVILHRELKSEFVNPEEFKRIVPENVYSAIVKDYNIYTVSPFVWKSRITNQRNFLYDEDLKIFFVDEVVFINCLDKTYLINFSTQDSFYKFASRQKGEVGFLGVFRSFFGKKIVFDFLIITELPDTDYLNDFLKKFEVKMIFSKNASALKDTSPKYESIFKYIHQEKIKELSAFSHREDHFEFFIFHPEREKMDVGFLLKYGEIKGFFMFNMSVSFQKQLLHSKESYVLKNVKFLYCYKIEPISTLKEFMGNPFIIKAGDERIKGLFSDGNLIYVEKKQ